MPSNISLDLTPIGKTPAKIAGAQRFRAADYRVHGGPFPAERHWLLRHPFARSVLRDRLEEVRPEVTIHTCRTLPEHEQLLDSMIDDLRLRDWPEPFTLAERAAAAVLLLRFSFAQGCRFSAPDWRTARGVRATS